MNEDRFSRLNQYRSMWVLVFFDLPAETKLERKAASRFRKDLLDNGFAMCQFRRTKNALPKKGKIGIMQITDKQFGMMELFHGQKEVETEAPSQQLELF